MNLLHRLLRRAPPAPAAAPLPPATPAEAELAARLRQEFDRLPAPAGRPTSAWDANMRRLRAHVGRADPRAFLTWDVVRDTMFVGEPDYVGVELAHLRTLGDFTPRWEAALREGAAGSPSRWPAYPATSGNLIHHAYHVARFEAFLGRPVDAFDTVLELGGGYGSMCRLWRNLGFRGDYVILDLPPFSRLQAYYLQLLDAQGGGGRFMERTWLVTDPADLAQVPRAGGPGGARALFLSTWALSETPPDVRARVEPWLLRCDALLLAFQDSFEGIDNHGYVAALRARAPGRAWTVAPIAHLPGNSYAFARREPPAPRA